MDMQPSPSSPLVPRFIVFEGVDGAGKTTLARFLAAYFRQQVPGLSLYAGSFPGALPHTLGEWVYRFHHRQITDAPSPDQIAPPALQLLHVAAHIDAILTHIGPMLASGGYVILDRYWWSTYGYSRQHLSPELAWTLVYPEQQFLAALPSPVIIYVTRSTSLKPHEVDSELHIKLDTYYREIIAAEQQAGIIVHELSNDGPLEQTWAQLLNILALPYHPL
ncbi:MAG: hypothetical protein ABI456_06400 [Ktedonobacteraceae bacterium]|nr:hypothetical protein [Chloroflexota bacterium]